jgi:hypothetical protein
MNAHEEIKRPFYPSFDARPVLAAAHLRLAAWVDLRVARWLERCASNAEAAQRLFKADRKPSRGFGMGVGLAVSSGPWDESR